MRWGKTQRSPKFLFIKFRKKSLDCRFGDPWAVLFSASASLMKTFKTSKISLVFCVSAGLVIKPKKSRKCEKVASEMGNAVRLAHKR